MHSAEGNGGSVAYKGMVDCFVRTVKEEGWQALFKVLACLTPGSARARYPIELISCLQSTDLKQAWRNASVSVTQSLLASTARRPCTDQTADDAGPVAELREGGSLHRDRIRLIRAAERDDGRAAEDIILRRWHGSLDHCDVGRGSVSSVCIT